MLGYTPRLYPSREACWAIYLLVYPSRGGMLGYVPLLVCTREACGAMCTVLCAVMRGMRRREGAFLPWKRERNLQKRHLLGMWEEEGIPTIPPG